VIVLSTGKVMWYPPTKFRSFCKPTGKTSAHCVLKIGSWTYNTDYLTLVPLKDRTKDLLFDLEQYNEACPYSMHNAKTEITEPIYNSNIAFSTVNVEFDIQATNY
jgi:hypothetical protein